MLKHQTGFIQGAILVGLALLVMVVAGFALANRDSSASTDKEEARLNASILISQATKLAAAGKRAYMDSPSTFVSSDVGSATQGRLFENMIANGFITEVPALPETAGVQAYYTSELLRISALAPDRLGGTSRFVVAVSGINEELCKAINHALYKEKSVPPAEAIHTRTGWTVQVGSDPSPWRERTAGCTLVKDPTSAISETLPDGSQNHFFFQLAVSY